MTKKIIMPSSINQIDNLINECDGFIVGITGFSVNNSVNLSLNDVSELIRLCNDKNKELFISINKNIHNNELNCVEDILIYLSKLNIAGIFYYDVAIVNLNKRLNLNLNLIWHQEHLTTNYATSLFWNQFGVNGVYLSSDITLDEIVEIRNNISMKIFVNVFGYLPMFASARHLVNNYLKTFSINDNSKRYKICKEGNSYTIIDNELGSFVYSSNILNGIDESLVFVEKNIDYVVLNSFLIDDDDFTKVVDLFTNLNSENVNEYSNIINNMFSNVDKGFLYKETVYKVKNNE